MSEANKNKVVKTNLLNTALQKLSLVEIRIIQLAIIDARESGKGLNTVTPLKIKASRYAEAFNTGNSNAYRQMKEAEATLFERQFTITVDGKPRKSRWLQDVVYLDNEGAIELVFTRTVVEGISRIDGAVDFFTSYLLSQTAALNSPYSVRLYELLAQWRTAKKIPTFETGKLKEQLGVDLEDYTRMYDFKKRVLDYAKKEITDKTDLTVTYDQVKQGKTIVGFDFSVKVKDEPKKPKEVKEVGYLKLSDKQISSFSKQLAALPELGSEAPIGDTVDTYARSIAIELEDKDKQKKYFKYLDKLGFKVS